MILRLRHEKVAWVTEYLREVSAPDLERIAYLGPGHGDVTIGRFIENAILYQAKEHLTNMKASTGM